MVTSRDTSSISCHLQVFQLAKEIPSVVEKGVIASTVKTMGHIDICKKQITFSFLIIYFSG